MFNLQTLLLVLCNAPILLSRPNNIDSTCKVAFTISNAGFLVEGKVTAIKYVAHFNPDSLATSYIEASASTTSVVTGIAMRDRHLQQQEYFDCQHYPTANVRSVSFQQSGKRTYTGNFDLTMKGITRQVKIPFNVYKQGKATRIAGHLILNRSDFSIGEPSAILSDKVNVTIEVIEVKK